MRTAVLLVKKRRAKNPELTYYENVGEAKLDYKDLLRKVEGSVSTEIEFVQLWTSSRGVTKRKRFREVSALSKPETEAEKAAKAEKAAAAKAAKAEEAAAAKAAKAEKAAAAKTARAEKAAAAKAKKQESNPASSIKNPES